MHCKRELGRWPLWSCTLSSLSLCDVDPLPDGLAGARAGSRFSRLRKVPNVRYGIDTYQMSHHKAPGMHLGGSFYGVDT